MYEAVVDYARAENKLPLAHTWVACRIGRRDIGAWCTRQRFNREKLPESRRRALETVKNGAGELIWWWQKRSTKT